MQQIVFLDSDTLDTGITLRHPDFPHHWQSYPSTAPEQVVERLKDASIAIINKVRIGADELARLLTNVVVVVEDEYEPQRWEDPTTELFGLYEGVPLTERAEFAWQMPDRIVVFRGPLTRHCTSRAELEDEITVTVMHEVGHFFGISEERLHELGWG